MLNGVEVVLNHIKTNRSLMLTEADTIRTIVLPMLRLIGWDIEDVSEVKSEYRHTSKENPVDCALFLNGQPALFVEAKALHVSLDDYKWTRQTLDYANAVGVRWCVLTNGAQWNVYKVHHEVAAEDKVFLKLIISDDTTADQVAEKLQWISRAAISDNRIQDLWRRTVLDARVDQILSTIQNSPKFVRLVRSELGDVAANFDEVRASLLRPDIGIMAHDAIKKCDPCGIYLHDEMDAPLFDKKKSLPKVDKMLEAGLLHIGQKLRIRGHSESQATIIDRRSVRYKGQDMSLNAWGCLIKGWSTIRIYIHAETETGDLLDDLRQKIKDLPE